VIEIPIRIDRAEILPNEVETTPEFCEGQIDGRTPELFLVADFSLD